MEHDREIRHDRVTSFYYVGLVSTLLTPNTSSTVVYWRLGYGKGEFLFHLGFRSEGSRRVINGPLVRSVDLSRVPTSYPGQRRTEKVVLWVDWRTVL